MFWGASPQCSSLADLIAAIVGLPCFRCNGTKVAGVQICGLVGIELCARRHRIFREIQASNVACGGMGKAAWGRGFSGFWEFSEFGELGSSLEHRDRSADLLFGFRQCLADVLFGNDPELLDGLKDRGSGLSKIIPH